MTAVIYERLQPGQGEVFTAMTFPALRHLLSLERSVRLPSENDQAAIDPLAIGAVVDGHPVGLILAELPLEDGRVPEILSLFVSKEMRGQGIARRLIEAVEDEVGNRGFGEIAAVYMTGKAGVDAFEKIAASRGWDEPRTRMVSVRFTVDSLQHAPWMGKYKLGEGWEISLWKEVSSAEKEEIRRTQQEDPWIPEDLVPWRHDQAGYDEQTSLVIRRQGQIVGWNINHRLSEDTVRYTCSFMRKPWGRMGKILPLYSESFRRIREAGYQKATFTTPLHHQGMAKFAKKWFGPWSTYLGETRGARKVLTRGLATV